MDDLGPSPGLPVDCAALIAELQELAEMRLARRAQKINAMLGATDQSVLGVAAAIDQISRMTLRFVDPLRRPDLV